MRKAATGLFAITNVALGLLYGRSDGPYLDVLGNGGVVSARELTSSGGNSGLDIAVALTSFVVAVAVAGAALPGWVGDRAVARTYAANYLVYACLLYAVHLDVSLVDSVRCGDWLLLCGLVVPAVPIMWEIVRLFRPGPSAHR